MNFKSNLRWNQSASFYIWKCAYCYQLTYCKDIAKDANILNMDNYGYSAGYLFHALTFIFKSEKHSCTKSYLFVCLHVIYFFISGSTIPVCFFYTTMDVNSDTWWLCESDVHQRLEMYTLKIWDSCAIAIYSWKCCIHLYCLIKLRMFSGSFKWSCSTLLQQNVYFFVFALNQMMSLAHS